MSKSLDRSEQDRHASFGLARFNTVSIGPPGASLFDSEIRHQHAILFEVHRAYRERMLNRDWLHTEGLPLVSLKMSMAQFGALVSSFGNGMGVPVTLDFAEGEQIEPPPYEPRMRHSVREVEKATEELLSEVTEAVTALRDAFEAKAGRKETADRLRTLEIKLQNAVPNARYAANTFTEHVENVVTKAKYDIEATVQMAVERGLDAGTSVAGLLGPAPEEDA